MKYCCHCGNFAVSEENSCCSECDSLKDTLRDVINEFTKFYKKYQFLLTIGIHVHYLHCSNTDDKDKQVKRKLKRNELLEKVSALRNTESGHIIIHLVGRNKEDKYQGALDKFADDTLRSLLNDSKFFVEVFKIVTFPEENYSNFFVLTVEKSKNVFTLDFKTKCVTDDNIVDVEEAALRQFLRDENTFGDLTTHHEPNYEQLKEGNLSLYESRNIQLKAIYQNGQGDEWIVEHLCEKLKLLHYVSAFSKNSEGGSYVAGVQEVKQEMSSEHNNNTVGTNTYVSMRLDYQSATVDCPKDLHLLIEKRVKDTCLVCDYEGNIEEVSDLVKTTLLQQTKDGEHYRNKYIIVVSVRPVCGLVFYDRKGPVAYVVSEKNPDNLVDSIKRLAFDKWFKDMKTKK